MKHPFALKAFSMLPALLAFSASLLCSQSQQTSSSQPSSQAGTAQPGAATPTAAQPGTPKPAQPQSDSAAQPQAEKSAQPSDKNAASDKDSTKPMTATTPPAVQVASKGCLAVKPIGSHLFRNVMLLGVTGALISKQQYKVMDVVNYPVSVGTKFHGDDLQTISSSGTKVVVLDKHYKEEDLQKACH